MTSCASQLTASPMALCEPEVSVDGERGLKMTGSLEGGTVRNHVSVKNEASQCGEEAAPGDDNEAKAPCHAQSELAIPAQEERGHSPCGTGPMAQARSEGVQDLPPKNGICLLPSTTQQSHVGEGDGQESQARPSNLMKTYLSPSYKFLSFLPPIPEMTPQMYPYRAVSGTVEGARDLFGHGMKPLDISTIDAEPTPDWSSLDFTMEASCLQTEAEPLSPLEFSFSRSWKPSKMEGGVEKNTKTLGVKEGDSKISAVLSVAMGTTQSLNSTHDISTSSASLSSTFNLSLCQGKGGLSLLETGSGNATVEIVDGVGLNSKEEPLTKTSANTTCVLHSGSTLTESSLSAVPMETSPSVSTGGVDAKKVASRNDTCELQPVPEGDSVTWSNLTVDLSEQSGSLEDGGKRVELKNGTFEVQMDPVQLHSTGHNLTVEMTKLMVSGQEIELPTGSQQNVTFERRPDSGHSGKEEPRLIAGSQNNVTFESQPILGQTGKEEPELIVGSQNNITFESQLILGQSGKEEPELNVGSQHNVMFESQPISAQSGKEEPELNLGSQHNVMFESQPISAQSGKERPELNLGSQKNGTFESQLISGQSGKEDPELNLGSQNNVKFESQPYSGQSGTGEPHLIAGCQNSVTFEGPPVSVHLGKEEPELIVGSENSVTFESQPILGQSGKENPELIAGCQNSTFETRKILVQPAKEEPRLIEGNQNNVTLKKPPTSSQVDQTTELNLTFDRKNVCVTEGSLNGGGHSDNNSGQIGDPEDSTACSMWSLDNSLDMKANFLVTSTPLVVPKVFNFSADSATFRARKRLSIINGSSDPCSDADVVSLGSSNRNIAVEQADPPVDQPPPTETKPPAKSLARPGSLGLRPSTRLQPSNTTTGKSLPRPSGLPTSKMPTAFSRSSRLSLAPRVKTLAAPQVSGGTSLLSSTLTMGKKTGGALRNTTTFSSVEPGSTSRRQSILQSKLASSGLQKPQTVGHPQPSSSTSQLGLKPSGLGSSKLQAQRAAAGTRPLGVGEPKGKSTQLPTSSQKQPRGSTDDSLPISKRKKIDASAPSTNGEGPGGTAGSQQGLRRPSTRLRAPHMKTLSLGGIRTTGALTTKNSGPIAPPPLPVQPSTAPEVAPPPPVSKANDNGNDSQLTDECTGVLIPDCENCASYRREIERLRAELRKRQEEV